MAECNAAIIITSCNTAPVLDLFLRSHAMFTQEEGVRFILSDASMDGSCKDVWDGFAADNSQAVLYVDFQQQHPSYSVMCDTAVRTYLEAGGDPRLLVFANDDTVATPDWLNIMRSEFDMLQGLGYRVGLLGARSNFVYGLQRGVWRPGEPGILACPRIVSFFCMIDTRAYLDVGGFDVNLSAHNYSDDALAVRLLQTGYYNFCSRAFIPHFGHQAFQRSGLDGRADAIEGARYMKEHLGENWKLIYDRRYPDLTRRDHGAMVPNDGTEYEVQI